MGQDIRGWRRGLGLVDGGSDRSEGAEEENLETPEDIPAPHTNAAHPRAPAMGVPCNSLLLLLLKLVISALLVLQLEAGVLQVTGQMVALRLQLVGQFLGPLVGALQLPELWESQNEAPRLVAP